MEYERFSDIYSEWTATSDSARANLAFYVDAYVATEGPVVELGVGDGRIAVQAASRGRSVIGVDASPAMLGRCRQRADRAGVSEQVTLMQADFRSFALSEPAALIALPYHSLGHLVSLDEKRDAIRHIHRQLRPGGSFVFDDFYMTPERIDQLRRVQLRAEYQSADGHDVLLWVTSLITEAAQSMRVVTWEDEVDNAGTMRERRYRMLSLSWLAPIQAQKLLTESGFTITACYGDFDRTPFDESTAVEHVWVARKGFAA